MVKRRSKLVRRSAGAIALITLAVVAFLVVTRLLERRDQPREQQRNPKLEVAPPMVRRENGLLVIEDYNAWFKVLPRAIRSAMRRGNRDAESILIEVFSSILPDQAWPPRPGSPDAWQWQEMVAQTAALLDDPRRPTPTQRPGLHVVTA